MLAASYPFLDVLWTMLIIFAWIIWFWLLITVFTDLFRRHDTSGFTKVLWIIFVIVVPFLGVFIYLIVNNHGMSERAMSQAQGPASADGRLRPERRGKRRRSGGDREGEGAARLRRDHADRVRRNQGEGARLRWRCSRRPSRREERRTWKR